MGQKNGEGFMSYKNLEQLIDFCASNLFFSVIGMIVCFVIQILLLIYKALLILADSNIILNWKTVFIPIVWMGIFSISVCIFYIILTIIWKLNK